MSFKQHFNEPIPSNQDPKTYTPDGKPGKIDSAVSPSKRRQNEASIAVEPDDRRNFAKSVRSIHSNAVSERFNPRVGIEHNTEMMNAAYEIAEKSTNLHKLGSAAYMKLLEDANSHIPPINFPKNLCDENGELMSSEKYVALFSTAMVIAALDNDRIGIRSVLLAVVNNAQNANSAIQEFDKNLIQELKIEDTPDAGPLYLLAAGLIARSASTNPNVFAGNLTVAKELLLDKNNEIFKFEDADDGAHEPPTPGPGPATPPPTPEADKNPKNESMWNKLTELVVGAEVVFAAWIATGELSKEWERRNTVDDRKETTTEKLLRIGASNGLFAAIPVVAFFAYRGIKANTQDNETLDAARVAVMRAIAGGAALFGIGQALNFFDKNGSATAEEVNAEAKKGVADYINMAKDAAREMGIGDLEIPESNGGRLDEALRAIRNKAENVYIGASEVDEFATVLRMAVRAGDGLSSYGFKVAEQFGVSITGNQKTDTEAVISLINEIVGRVGTSAETVESGARLTRAIATAIIQARNPNLAVTTKIVQGLYQVVDAISAPAPKRVQTDAERVAAAEKAVSKLSGILTATQVEALREAIRSQAPATEVA